MDEATEPPNLVLRFHATQNEPDFMTIFMEGGGAINAAAARWETDFALTSSKEATWTKLNPSSLTSVSIPIPKEMIIEIVKEPIEDKGEGEIKCCVRLRNELRLNVGTSRIGAAINGTLVSSVSGLGSGYLCDVMRGMQVSTPVGDVKGGHAQIGLVYSSWMAHAASIGISNARIVAVDPNTSQEVEYVPEFVAREESLKVSCEKAAEWVEKYVQKAWAVRQALVYPPSPTLTKAVFKETVGVNGTGFSLLHDVLVREAPLGYAALESLFKAAILSTLGDEKKVQEFFDTTEIPGMAAAQRASDLATATSIAVSHMVAYRSDGRNVVTAMGADFAPAESWLRQAQRTAIEANDCDGSALLAVGMLRSALTMSQQDMDATVEPSATGEEDAPQKAAYKYPTLRRVRNILHPYYHVGIAVVGAMSAEASSLANDAGEDLEPVVAGHAIALMVPSIGLLRGLAKATGRTLGDTSQQIVAEKAADILEVARFRAMFPTNLQESLTGTDKAFVHKKWEDIKDDLDHDVTKLKVVAIEGTTPAEARLYQPNTVLRSQAEKRAEKDDAAFTKVAPNVFRSVKSMHVGGGHAGSTHRFYRDIVEVTFARDFPLYQSKNVRTLGAAATQYVFARAAQGDKLRVAGASPRDLHEDEFVVVPLIQLKGEIASELDTASTEAEKDVIPPRSRKPMRLTPIQTESLSASRDALEKLHEHFSNSVADGKFNEDDMHAVSYQVAYSTLVHNPSAVQQFCDVLKKNAVAASVAQLELKGFAETSDSKNAGVFVTINAVMPV